MLAYQLIHDSAQLLDEVMGLSEEIRTYPFRTVRIQGNLITYDAQTSLTDIIVMHVQLSYDLNRAKLRRDENPMVAKSPDPEDQNRARAPFLNWETEVRLWPIIQHNGVQLIADVIQIAEDCEPKLIEKALYTRGLKCKAYREALGGIVFTGTTFE